jgi:hypothetical protein
MPPSAVQAFLPLLEVPLAHTDHQTALRLGCLEDSPNLASIRKFLDTMPDGRLLAELREHRGKGRNDYPMHVLWGVLLLTILLRHPSVEACHAVPGKATQWKGEQERLLPGHDGTSNIVYDEAGTVYCYDKVSEPPVRRPMAYIGHEPERGTLKYRCPAMHEGFTCPMASICPSSIIPRRFQPTRSFPRTVRCFSQATCHPEDGPPGLAKGLQRNRLHRREQLIALHCIVSLHCISLHCTDWLALGVIVQCNADVTIDVKASRA